MEGAGEWEELVGGRSWWVGGASRWEELWWEELVGGRSWGGRSLSQTLVCVCA